MIVLPKIINKAELARKMGIEPQNLNNKLKGTNRQTFTYEDYQKVIEILKETIAEIEEGFGEG